MVSQSDFYNLIQAIVVDVLPDEQDTLDISGESVIADLYAGKGGKSAGMAEFKFGVHEVVKDAEEVIPLITATFTMVKAIVDYRTAKTATSKQERIDKIKERWVADLVDIGLSRKKALIIAEKRSADVEELTSKR